MSFQYKVRDSLGKILTGQIDVQTADEATQQLGRDGFQLLELREGEDDSAGELRLFRTPIRRAEIIYATSQLGIMLETGVSLSAALGTMIREEHNTSLRKVLVELNGSVESGSDFSAALAKHPKVFDRTYIALVKASEATGSLGPALDRIAQYLRKNLDTRAKIRAALAYPCVMLVLALGVTIFLLTYVLPQFMPLFERKGVELPRPTLILMGLSHGMNDHWYVVLGSLAALVFGGLYGRTTEAGRRAIDWAQLNAPLVGTMFRKVILSRSVHTLGTMLNCGVPMLDAINLTSEVARNSFYRKAWQFVAEQVTGGSQIYTSLVNNPLFPSILVQMISAGEQTGKLGTVLERISGHYDQEVETTLKTTTSLIEPLLITVMGVVVGGIAMSLLLPIFTLSRSAG